MTALDSQGVTIMLGNKVHVDYIDRSRGAEMWMGTGIVVGFGRTRVKVRFPSRTQSQAVGSECLTVVKS